MPRLARLARLALPALLLVAVGARPAVAAPAVVLTYETGPLYIATNDGRYGEAGTPYDAADVGQQDTLVRGERAAVELVVGRHRVLALYAPFVVATQVALASELRFRDTTFPAGAVVAHLYRFDGYRASYLYLIRDGRLAIELGGSLQIRSADVAFTRADGDARASQSDIGVVPALKARLTYTPGRAWAMVEADGSSTFGLVGDTSGALYDVAVSGGYDVRPNLAVYGTVRVVGGGADVPAQAIDNWANFVSASLGVRLTLGERPHRARPDPL